jgi:molybdate transport system substrate-binding protein
MTRKYAIIFSMLAEPDWIWLFQIHMVKRVLSLLSSMTRGIGLSFAGILLVTGALQAAVVRVVSSGGFAAAYRALAPEFERATRNTLVTSWGPSMGNTPDTVPVRIQRGEPIDVVIMVDYALSDLIKGGKVIADSRVELARSSIGVAVRAGAPKPDISSVDALRRTLLEAKSIAYSDSASGVYISTELFKRLGIADQVAGKSRMIPAEPVGAVVARGEAEIGFQQLSELKPIAGIDLVGPLPPEVQKITIFSAGIVVGAREPDAARALIAFLASPAAAAAIKESGMEPMTSAAHEMSGKRTRTLVPLPAVPRMSSSAPDSLPAPAYCVQSEHSRVSPTWGSKRFSLVNAEWLS